MITAPLYMAGFSAFAAIYWLAGDRCAARIVMMIVAALPLMWLAVATSPVWPLWATTIWAIVGAVVFTQRHQCPSAAGVAIFVELAALPYLLLYLGVHFGWASWASNALGVVAVLVAGGPTWRALIDDPADTYGTVRNAFLGLARFGPGGGG